MKYRNENKKRVRDLLQNSTEFSFCEAGSTFLKLHYILMQTYYLIIRGNIWNTGVEKKMSDECRTPIFCEAVLARDEIVLKSGANLLHDNL